MKLQRRPNKDSVFAVNPMDKAMFEAVDPLIDEIAELTDAVLRSMELVRVREALVRVATTLGNRYSVNFSVIVDVYDQDKERCLPLLNRGLSTSAGRQPHRTFGDYSPQRYIVDVEMQIVPHDRCPKCWEVWDLKWEHHSCPHCDAVLGVNCKVLLESDTCPNCEKGTVSISSPVCEKCGFQIDPAFVVWG
jgi:hypothetical protein